MKKTAIWVIAAIVIVGGIWFFRSRQATPPSSPSPVFLPTPPLTSAQGSQTAPSDSTGAINQELQSINPQSFDNDFQGIDNDIKNL